MDSPLPKPHFDLRGRSAFPLPDPLPAHDLGALLIRAGECLQASLLPPLAAAGLNIARFNVLDTVRSGGADGCSQAHIASRLLQSESNLSSLLDRMHADGLLVRERSAVDRRKTMIRLSPAGEQAWAAASRSRNVALAQQLNEIDEDTRALLAPALSALVQTLEHHLHVREKPGFSEKTGFLDRLRTTAPIHESAASPHPVVTVQ